MAEPDPTRADADARGPGVSAAGVAGAAPASASASASESASASASAAEPQPRSGPPRPVHQTRGPSEFALGGVLLAVVIGLALVGQDHWRRGLLLAGIGLLAGAVLRLVLPARVAGLLVVRGRVFDAVVLAVLGAAVIALTSSVPLPPGSG